MFHRKFAEMEVNKIFLGNRRKNIGAYTSAAADLSFVKECTSQSDEISSVCDTGRRF